jgi:PGAP1-like protein
MPARIRTHVGDLRGAVRLATDATAGLADLVEAVHHRIVRLPGRGATVPAERTRGLTGLVYKSVRGVVRLVGGSVDALLALITPALRDGQPQPEREAVVAALNGVLGDHLAASANPLAIRMTLRDGDHAVVPEREKLAERLPRTTGRVVVMVHGLCMNHIQWTRNGHDHGNALARDLGFTPLRLHYNTGLHISINGAELAQQLEDLVTEWPGRLQRLVLLGHSMGGLVLRSACHQGRLAGHRWPQAVGDLICLGTPHHGAPLERAGHWIDTVLGATPYAAPFARLGKVRSAGITDLRHGHLLAQEGAGRDRVGPRHPKGPRVPLPAGVRCFAVAGTLDPADPTFKGRLLGDGLVPLDSALGRHADPARALAFAPDRQWIARGVNHLDLLSDAAVYHRLRHWLA